jgi:hypothetical protein
MALKDNPSYRKDLATIASSLDYCDRQATSGTGVTVNWILILTLSSLIGPILSRVQQAYLWGKLIVGHLYLLKYDKTVNTYIHAVWSAWSADSMSPFSSHLHILHP